MGEYTPEKREKQKGYNDTYNEKINNNPLLKKEKMKKQVEANARYNAKKTPEQKQRDREYNTNYKKALRAKEENQEKLLYFLYMMLDIKKNETNPNFQKALKAGHLKQFQQKVSCEQAEQIEFFK